MSWKKFIIGEPMPDKNDPKYKERYEREVEAGRKFANIVGISWLARNLQRWGQNHRNAILIIVFGIVLTCFFVNVYRLTMAFHHHRSGRATAVERVDQALQKNHALSNRVK